MSCLHFVPWKNRYNQKYAELLYASGPGKSLNETMMVSTYARNPKGLRA